MLGRFLLVSLAHGLRVDEGADELCECLDWAGRKRPEVGAPYWIFLGGPVASPHDASTGIWPSTL